MKNFTRTYTPEERKYYERIEKFNNIKSAWLMILLLPFLIVFIVACSPETEFDHFVNLCERFKRWS